MLLERDGELAALRAAVTRAASGSGSATLVIGPPGIGKSALLAALAADVGDAQVLSGRGGELEQEFPYGVVRQLFEGALRNADDELRAALLSGPARPAGALIGGEHTEMASDAPALQHAFYWLTVNLAERRPVVLLIDDAHWADAASMRTLVFLARRLADHPVALVVATRPADGTPRSYLDRLAGEVDTLRPAALTERGVESLVHRRLIDADAEFCLACFSASGGNPFLVTELIGAVQASGIAPTGANAKRVRSVDVQNVKRSVLLRLNGLSAAATPVARAISVLGECRQVEFVARIADTPVATVISVLDALRAAHIFAEDDPIRFVHSIVHSAVYTDIAAAQRSSLHSAAAHVLADAGASSDAVAGHLLFTTPGVDQWVFDQLSAAASGGVALSTPETTAAYLERALQESVVTGSDRAAPLFALGAARYQTVDGGAVEPLRAALSLATNPWMRMAVGRALASAYMTENRYDECWTLVDRLIDDLGPDADLVSHIEVFAAQALFTDMPRAPERLPMIRRWRPDGSGASGLDRSMLAVRSWVTMADAGPAGTTAAAARAALSSGTLLADDTWYVTFDMAVSALVAAGCHEEAMSCLDAAIGSRRAIGQLLRAATLMPARSDLRRRLGQLQLAEEDARVAVDVIPKGQVFAPHSASALVSVLLERGELEEARGALVEHGFDVSIPRGGLNDLVWLARGRLRIAEGDRAGGLADVLHYGAICAKLGRRNPGHFPWRSTAAATLVELGRRDEALALAQEECRLAEATGVAGLRGRALGVLGIAQQSAESIASLTAALALLQRSPLLLDTAYTQVALGRSMRLSGKRVRAREPLRLALDTATRIGARPLAERAQQELVAAGARPRRQVVQGVGALTPSELRVAALAAQGLTNRELAHSLYVTPKTIEAHLAAAYRKLGIAGKAGLAAVLDVDEAGAR